MSYRGIKLCVLHFKFQINMISALILHGLSFVTPLINSVCQRKDANLSIKEVIIFFCLIIFIKFHSHQTGCGAQFYLFYSSLVQVNSREICIVSLTSEVVAVTHPGFPLKWPGEKKYPNQTKQKIPQSFLNTLILLFFPRNKLGTVISSF